MKKVFPVVVFLISILTTLTAFSITCFASDTATLTVELTGFRNDDGVARVALYNSSNKFADDRGNGAFQALAVPIKDGNATAVFEKVPFGEYAVCAFHDKNNSGRLERSFFGAPQEQYGASNNLVKKNQSPKFDTCKFILDNEEMNIIIKMIKS